MGIFDRNFHTGLDSSTQSLINASEVCEEQILTEYYEYLNNGLRIPYSLQESVLRIWRKRKVPEFVINNHIDAWRRLK